MAIATAALPERILLAAATLQDLVAKQVYFVPVRHHSPACSMALQKWLTELKVTTFAADEAYWTPRGYSAKAPIKFSSRIA